MWPVVNQTVSGNATIAFGPNEVAPPNSQHLNTLVINDGRYTFNVVTDPQPVTAFFILKLQARTTDARAGRICVIQSRLDMPALSVGIGNKLRLELWPILDSLLVAKLKDPINGQQDPQARCPGWTPLP